MGGAHDKRYPRRIFSQVAMLNGDGSIHCSELTIFDDYQQATGPLSAEGRSRIDLAALPPRKKTDEVEIKPTSKGRKRTASVRTGRHAKRVSTKKRRKSSGLKDRRKPK